MKALIETIFSSKTSLSGHQITHVANRTDVAILCAAVPTFATIHLEPEILAQYGLPNIAYPVAGADLLSALGAGTT